MNLGKVKISLLIGILIVSICSTIFYSLSIGRDISERYTSLTKTVLKFKIEVTTAHLWLEEGISGDGSIDIEKIWQQLDLVEQQINAILESGMGMESATVEGVNLQREVKLAIRKIRQFREIAQQRWVKGEDSEAGAKLDQQLDSVFLGFISGADKIEGHLNELNAKQLQYFWLIQHILIAF